MRKIGRIYIGTSGWHYLHWKGPFYEKDLSTNFFLKAYTKFFNTVEINNSFYRLPQKKTFLAWKKIAPKGFTFSVKGSRFITHIKHLKDPKSSLRRLLSLVAYLKPHLGPILFQLPPHWDVDLHRLEMFLKCLPSHMRFAFELRDRRWVIDPVIELLKKYKVAFCIDDYYGEMTPQIITTDFVYMRFHGPTGQYGGSYSKSFLKKWAITLKELSHLKNNIYCYFNNDEAGYAPKNALALKKLIDDI